MRNPLHVLTKAIAHLGTKRSPHWPAARRAHLKREPFCRYCGHLDNLEVHHVVPFHLHPELELEESNFITLCEQMSRECHLKLGHLGNWKNSNPQVRLQCTVTKATP